MYAETALTKEKKKMEPASGLTIGVIVKWILGLCGTFMGFLGINLFRRVKELENNQSKFLVEDAESKKDIQALQMQVGNLERATLMQFENFKKDTKEEFKIVRDATKEEFEKLHKRFDVHSSSDDGNMSEIIKRLDSLKNDSK